MPLEVLNVLLVLLCLGHRRKGAEVAPIAGFCVLFARIKPVLAGFELANHVISRCTPCARRCLQSSRVELSSDSESPGAYHADSSRKSHRLPSPSPTQRALRHWQPMG